MIKIKQLEGQIKELTKLAGGTWGVVIEDLDKGISWSMNENEVYVAASVIKTPIMAAAYALEAEGKLSLDDFVTLQREDLVGGSGVLQHMTPGTKLSIYDLLMLMIIQSDNTATNMLVDLVGVKQIQQTMKDIGMKNSSFFNKLMIVPVNIPGSNVITASDVNVLTKKLVLGDFVSHYACEQMIEIMKRQQIDTGLPVYLPTNKSNLIGVKPEWEVAHKTGSITNIQHDTGVFYVGDRTVVVTVLSKDCEQVLALDTIGKIGLSVYQYMKKCE